jgi:preprotein translocase subunit SecD
VRVAASGAVAAALIILLSACGGDDSEPVTIAFQAQVPADTSDLNAAALTDATVAAMRQRAEFYGLDVPEITVSPDNVITIETEGIDQLTATQLFGTRAALEFKQPVLTVEGIVSCLDSKGERFGVPPQAVNPDDASRSPARCFSTDKIGDPEWEPAVSANGNQLTVESVQAGGWEQRDDALFGKFTPAGATTLEEVTRELTGYPLGLFVDGELIAAPRINRAITNGEAFISGFGADQARLRAAQLNSGPLALELSPVTVSPTAP